MKKYHQFLYGRTFLLLTDCLSRLPQETDPEFETFHAHEPFHAYEPVVNLIQERQINCLPLSADMVKKEKEKDTLLSQVLLKINQGWPSSSKNLPKELHPYFHRKLQLTVHNGCILLSHRVVIPSSLRQQVLTEIHEGHMGIVRMKSLARMHVWWPKIDESIETHPNQCISCQENSRQPNKAPVLTWENPKEPWKRLHVDFAGPYEGSMWLIVIDAATKWPEVIQMNSNTKAERTIEVLRSLFSRLGIPNQIVSDNGPQFTSDVYHQFCTNNGIRRTLIAPITHDPMVRRSGSSKLLKMLLGEESMWVYKKLYVSFY